MLRSIFLFSLVLGINNLSTSIGIGMTKFRIRKKVKIAFIFAFFEFFVPIIGIFIGNDFNTMYGNIIAIIGDFTLCALGLYLLVNDTAIESISAPSATIGIILTALALSLDNLAIGFYLGAYELSFLIPLLFFSVTTFFTSIIGLTLGSKLTRFRESIRYFPGILLLSTGLSMLISVLSSETFII